MENLENPRKRSTAGSSVKLNKSWLAAKLAGKTEGLISLILVASFLIAWEILARLGILSTLIFPEPSVIFQTFLNGIWTGKYLENLKLSLFRMIAGFLLGGGFGMVLGLLMGWSRRLRGIVDPIVAGLHPIPKFALLPMAIILLGIGEAPRIAMISVAAFFPLVINSTAGVLQISPAYYEVLESYGASRLDVFRKVVLPGSLPFVLTGVRLSLRNALTITIGIEMIFGNTGLGSALWVAWETMRLTDMYAILLIIIIIGAIIMWLLELSRRFLTPWYTELHADQ